MGLSSGQKNTLLALLSAVTVALAGVVAYVTNLEPDNGGIAGSGGIVASGGKGGAGGKGAAGSPVIVVDAGTPPVVVPPTKQGFSLGIQTWFVDPSWSGEKLFSSKGVISPTFVQQVSQFSTFRTMDAAAINCSKESSWSGRKLPSDADQTAYGARDGSGKPGVAWEYLIDIANAANTGLWVNIPHLATDDYVTQLAALLKSRAKTQVYVEYTNESWNGSFCQFSYVNAQGLAAGLGGGNQYYAGGAFTLKQALRFGDIVKRQVPNAITVFAFSGNFDVAGQALKGSSQKPDMLAIAPYVSTSGQNGSNVTLAAWKAEVDTLASGSGDSIASARKIADSNGVKLLGCYEAGSHYTSNADVAAKNAAAMGEGFKYMLDEWSKRFNAPCNLYTHASEQKSGGAWGLYDTTGALTLKGKATVEWLAAH